jgi:hypothetical protein
MPVPPKLVFARGTGILVSIFRVLKDFSNYKSAAIASAARRPETNAPCIDAVSR